MSFYKYSDFKKDVREDLESMIPEIFWGDIDKAMSLVPLFRHYMEGYLHGFEYEVHRVALKAIVFMYGTDDQITSILRLDDEDGDDDA